MRGTFSRYATSATTPNPLKTSKMINIDIIIESQMKADDVVAGSSWSAHKERARELVKECKKRDKEQGKITVAHPTLPNTWLLVTPKKAAKMGLI